MNKQQVKDFFTKALYFFRVTDDNGVISLTHLALWTCIVKLAVASPASVSDIGALFVSILAYSYKKYMANQTTNSVEYTPEIETRFKDIEQKVLEAQGKVNGMAMKQAITNTFK